MHGYYTGCGIDMSMGCEKLFTITGRIAIDRRGVMAHTKNGILMKAFINLRLGAGAKPPGIPA
jgi:hypothetical protein